MSSHRTSLGPRQQPAPHQQPPGLTLSVQCAVQQGQKPRLPEGVAAVHQLVAAALKSTFEAHLPAGHPLLRRTQTRERQLQAKVPSLGFLALAVQCAGCYLLPSLPQMQSRALELDPFGATNTNLGSEPNRQWTVTSSWVSDGFWG